MQPHRPLRPLEQLTQEPESMEASAAAQAAARTSQGFNLSNLGRSAFTAVPPTTGLYPDLALFSQFNQLFPQGGAGGLDPSVLSLLGQQQQQHQQQQQQQQQQAGQADAGRAAGARGKAKANDNKTSSAYASRHQAAEQRRRTRINDRLDRLRSVVPHADRANTAAFLEEVINYIQKLQQRVQELESGLPASDKTEMPVGNAAAAPPRSQSPQVHQDANDGLLSGAFATLPDVGTASQASTLQAQKRERDDLLAPTSDIAKAPPALTDAALPGQANADKDAGLAEKRLKLGEGNMASLLG